MAIDMPFPFDGITEKEVETSRTYAVDWKNNRVVGMVDGLEAVNQFIHKALITPRFKCLIYDNQYGSEIVEAVIEKDATQEYIETEMPFWIEDTIIHDARILKVENVEVSFEKDSVYISCDVATIFGRVHIEEVY